MTDSSEWRLEFPDPRVTGVGRIADLPELAGRMASPSRCVVTDSGLASIRR